MSDSETEINTRYALYINGNIQNQDGMVYDSDESESLVDIDPDNKVLNAPWNDLINRIMSYKPIDAVFVTMWDDRYKNHFKMCITWRSSEMDIKELESEVWNLRYSLYEILEIPKYIHLEFVTIVPEAL